MAVVDFLAEGGVVSEGASEAASEGASVVRGIPASSVEGPDTGPWSARDEVTPGDKHTHISRGAKDHKTHGLDCIPVLSHGSDHLKKIKI